MKFSPTQGKNSRPLRSENRNYFVILGLITLNDVVPVLGQNVETLVKKGSSRKGNGIAISEIQEQYNVIDIALSVVAAAIPGVAVVFSGSRSSELNGSVYEE